MTYIRSHKIFYIDSRNRTDGTDSNFSVKLDLPSHHNFNRICVLQAVVPKSYYVVQDGYNTFDLVEEGITETITIPPMNYNRRSLAVELMNLLNQNSPHNYTYDISFPNHQIEGDDGKYTITVTDNNNNQPSIIVKDNGVSELLGFDANTTNVFVSNKIKSKHVCKIQSEDVLRIHSNISDNNGDDILLEIYANSDPTFSNIVWLCPDVQAYSRELTGKTTNKYSFFLTSEDNTQLLDLNGLNFNMTIIVYRLEDRMFLK